MTRVSPSAWNQELGVSVAWSAVWAASMQRSCHTGERVSFRDGSSPKPQDSRSGQGLGDKDAADTLRGAWERHSGQPHQQYQWAFKGFIHSEET